MHLKSLKNAVCHREWCNSVRIWQKYITHAAFLLSMYQTSDVYYIDNKNAANIERELYVHICLPFSSTLCACLTVLWCVKKSYIRRASERSYLCSISCGVLHAHWYTHSFVPASSINLPQTSSEYWHIHSERLRTLSPKTVQLSVREPCWASSICDCALKAKTWVTPCVHLTCICAMNTSCVFIELCTWFMYNMLNIRSQLASFFMTHKTYWYDF